MLCDTRNPEVASTPAGDPSVEDEQGSVGLNRSDDDDDDDNNNDDDAFHSSSSTDDSVELLNELGEDEGDVAAVALLKQIFDDETDTEALRRQHLAFCSSLSNEYQEEEEEECATGESIRNSKRLTQLHPKGRDSSSG